jgi:hypothetical protein
LYFRAVEARRDTTRPGLTVVDKARVLGSNWSVLLTFGLVSQTRHQVELLGPQVVPSVDALTFVYATRVRPGVGA